MDDAISLPAGFLAAGRHCGIKSNPKALDLTLLASKHPATAAGVFTQNRVVGAPVTVCRDRLPSDAIRAVVINSGNANACTGHRGLADAEDMTAVVADQLSCASEHILVMSTGVIGRFLPMEKIREGIPPLCAQAGGGSSDVEAAARGMMTTDTFPKLATRQCTIDGVKITVTGVAKGAAMIAPNMATMLAVLMTDARLPVSRATSCLAAAVNQSFNCISVDGHTSTSDSVVLLANGQAGVAPESDSDGELLQSAVTDVARDLAKMIIRDAEGAEHFVTIDVTGLPSDAEAHRVAKTIAESALVKTAVTGNDPNWGRIISAAGYSGVEVQPEQMRLSINTTEIFRDGAPTDADLNRLSKQLAGARDVHIALDCGSGSGAACFWTSDLTAEYVRLNSEYTT